MSIASGVSRGVEAVAVGFGAWLVVAPGSWSWVGATSLDPYHRGVALAAAAGALTLVGSALVSIIRHRLVT